MPSYCTLCGYEANDKCAATRKFISWHFCDECWEWITEGDAKIAKEMEAQLTASTAAHKSTADDLLVELTKRVDLEKRLFAVTALLERQGARPAYETIAAALKAAKESTSQ